MAWLNAYLPAVDAVAIAGRLARIAKAVDDDERTASQMRADAFVDILLDEGALLPPADGHHSLREPKRHRGIRPDVHVTVPVLSLVGQDQAPAHLDGYGPIDHETAAELAANAWEEGGETRADNLAHLCRGHHSLKHKSRWSARQDPDGSGTLRWTSPLGRRYTTSPAIAVSPRASVMTEWWTGDPEEPPGSSPPF